VKNKNFTRLVFLLSFSLLCVSCSLFDIAEPKAQSWGEDWPKTFQVYFTEPGISMGTGVDRNMTERIGNFIRSAKKSVDINIYELSAPAIYNAIIEMHKAGRTVRFVGDGDNADYEGYKALAAAEVPMCITVQPNIMHNKFVVVDRERITMGSMNYTDNSALRNNENVVFIQNKDIAEYYTKEVDNMFDNGARGLNKKPWPGFANNTFYLDKGEPTETKVEVFFSPYVGAISAYTNGTKSRMIAAINGAKETIHFAIFSYTDRDTAKAMEDAVKRGVHVYGVFDAGWHLGNAYALHQRLTYAGGFISQTNNATMNVRMDGNENFDPKNPYHGCKIHNKLLVVDADLDTAIVQTGSLNFSPAAATDGNDENTIFIHNKAIAQCYRDEIMRMYDRGWHLTKSFGGQTAVKYDVVIDEINWAGSLSDTGSANSGDKFVALRNRTDDDINISGWMLYGTRLYSYRIVGHVFPANTIIKAKGYHILGYVPGTSAFNWDSTWSSSGYIQDMPTAASATGADIEPFISNENFNYCYVRLRDVDQNTIDEGGRIAAGNGSNSPKFSSMKRTGRNGMLSASWTTVTAAGEAVKEGYRGNTLASPGAAYSGSTNW